MKRVVCMLGLALMIAGEAAAGPVCYQTNPFNERLVLTVVSNGGLGSNQKAFRVHGKHVGTCGLGTAPSIDGTVYVQKKPTEGAHMGLHTNTVRSGCVGLSWECTTDSKKATPDTWSCNLKTDPSNLSETLTPVTLTKIEPDANCAVFEGGAVVPAFQAGAPGSGSGQQ